MSSRAADLNAILQRAVACHQAGLLDEAEELYRKVLKRHPRQFDGLHLLGVVRYQRGACQEALRHIDLALKVEPKVAAAHANRAAALLELKRLDEALASCDRAIALQTDCLEAHSTRGAVLVGLTRFAEALASCDRAIALKPDLAQGFNNRGCALKGLNRLPEALASVDRAIALSPDHADAHNNRANVLIRFERFDDAMASARRAIAVRPEFGEAHHNLGTAFLGLKRHEDAIKSYRRALELAPDLELLRGAYVQAKLFACDWAGLDEERLLLETALAKGQLAGAPGQLVAVLPEPALQLKAAEHFAVRYVAPAQPLWGGAPYAHDRIRVAYLSADFGDHPVSYLAVGAFEQHDRSRFETIAVSYGPESRSPIRQRLTSAFERFIDARAMTGEEVAGLLRALEIDIVVDLSGHTDGSRPDVLARRPAPVQVNWLGYPGTMASACWDYIIADPFVIPEGHAPHYREKVARLPDCFMPTDHTRPISPHVPSRAEAGLPDGGTVLCCFNNSYKFTPEVFDIWMRVLRGVAGSVLWLSGPGAGAVDNLRREAEARGVAPDRLVFAPRLPRNEDHLARLKLADLFLDTFGYNAHATAVDALWSGVPIVTCAGQAFASRVAGSLLHAIGLAELVTTSPPDYEALALELAGDPAHLSSLRERLARNRETCPLFDTARFTRHIESAYTVMWDRAQRGAPPQGIDVSAVERSSA